ncbi:MAG: MotA/TolQ/ExbB proton channel family protein [Victivallaceae bacterium]|nr:MotA/TolQ/ExbB proton channel family protein [Victivallaceae bacterium]
MSRKINIISSLVIVVIMFIGLGSTLCADDKTNGVSDDNSSMETNLEALVAEKILKKLEPLNQIRKVNAESVKAAKSQRRFFIFSGGLLGFLVWVFLLVNSGMAVLLLARVLDHIHKSRILPKKLIDTIRAHLADGELGFAIGCCNESEVPLARIMLAAFKYIEDGFDAAKDAMHIAVKTEEEKLWKPIKTLLPCAIISFTIGLCGTILMLITLLKDYAANSSVGAGQVLAYASAQACYPFIIGAVGSCIVFLLFVYSSIKASRIAVNTEMLSFDIIKVLRGAELVDDDFPKIGTMTQLINK